ncbi:hypothetical protein B0O99DRAFT_688292 [Bisporella sp. PMI_857]|nr:hypothetical protein B0O99DRAFT_688292 [Bisporella sp. PMI_857]
MDNILFYQPPSASSSQPLRFSGTVTAPHLPPGSIASLPARQTATLVSTLSPKPHTSDRHCRNDKQEAFTASRNLPNRSGDNGDDFPDIEELLSGTRQKSLPASADLDDDDHDGFVDIDELLSGMQQKGQTSVDTDYGRMAANMVNDGTRGGSPTNSSRSTAGGSRDSIILSDDESAGAESETDYSNLEVDLAKCDSSSPHITDSDIANG